MMLLMAATLLSVIVIIPFASLLLIGAVLAAAGEFSWQ